MALPLLETTPKTKKERVEPSLAATPVPLEANDILAVGSMNKDETDLLDERLKDPDDLGRFFPGVKETG